VYSIEFDDSLEVGVCRCDLDDRVRDDSLRS